MNTDRIEKNLILRAPRTRVWRAIANANEFGDWFGIALDGAFVPGTAIMAHLTAPGFEHLSMDVMVERVEPEHLFTYRWHPYAIDPAVDYSREPTTLVEFHLADATDGTQLTIIESGFDQIPPARRATAFRMNDRGWTEQLTNLTRYVAD